MVCTFSGDVGDGIFLLSLFSQLPNGPHTILLEPSPHTKFKTEADIPRLHSLLAPLVEKQPYIAEFRQYRKGDHVDWRSQDFRKNQYQIGNTLLGAHRQHLIDTCRVGQDHDETRPWLMNIKPSPLSKGCVVINKTGRYGNGMFNWGAVVKNYSWRILFVGQNFEHRDFCSRFGFVDFAPTSNMLEVAELIKGSELFIGNQSCPNAIAEGLKHPLVQEVSTSTPDCVFKRPNAQHVLFGKMRLPAIGDMPEVEVTSKMSPRYEDVMLAVQPRSGWFNKHGKRFARFEALQKDVMKEEGITAYEAKCVILDDLYQKEPSFFPLTPEEWKLKSFAESMQMAR